MQRKDLVPDSSVSILLVVPEGNNHQTAAEEFLADQNQIRQAIFFNNKAETLKIDTVREILHHTSFARAKNEPQTIVICAAQNATLPAQNALLKIVEEPPANTQIILTATPGHQLLPTLISRCREIIWSTTTHTDQQHELADQFQQDLHEKTQQIKTFLQNPKSYTYSDLILLADELSAPTIAKQILLTILGELTTNQLAVDSPKITQQLLIALDSLKKNGNVKLVLEHLFFTINKLT